MSSKDLVYKTGPEGEDLIAAVHWAPDATGLGAKRPIAILLHGGAFLIGSKSFIPQIYVTKLTALGFVVVSPNYRLCPQVSLEEGPWQDTKDLYAWCRNGLPEALERHEGVQVDGSRIVAAGFSAGGTLALLLGVEAQPPSAILDVYGMISFQNPHFHLPNPGFAHYPILPDSVLSKVRSGPVPSAWPPMRDVPPEGPSAVPPRNAYTWAHLKNGTLMKELVPDGDFDRVDPLVYIKKLGEKFPPTCFLHGTADVSCPYETSVEAYEALKGFGVDAKLVAVEGVDHFFDMFPAPENVKFVDEAIQFVVDKVPEQRRIDPLNGDRTSC